MFLGDHIYIYIYIHVSNADFQGPCKYWLLGGFMHKSIKHKQSHNQILQLLVSTCSPHPKPKNIHPVVTKTLNRKP